MKFNIAFAAAFVGFSGSSAFQLATPRRSPPTSLPVSIGIGPDENQTEEKKLVAGVDYEVPDHEEYRLSRRSTMDEQCDEWYGKLLGSDNGIMGSLATEMREILTTPVPLVNEVSEVNALSSFQWCVVLSLIFS